MGARFKFIHSAQCNPAYRVRGLRQGRIIAVGHMHQARQDSRPRLHSVRDRRVHYATEDRFDILAAALVT